MGKDGGLASGAFTDQDFLVKGYLLILGFVPKEVAHCSLERKNIVTITFEVILEVDFFKEGDFFLTVVVSTMML